MTPASLITAPCVAVYESVIYLNKAAARAVGGGKLRASWDAAERVLLLAPSGDREARPARLHTNGGALVGASRFSRESGLRGTRWLMRALPGGALRSVCEEQEAPEMQNNVNKNMIALAEQWGIPRVTFHLTYWRLWFDGWHLHRGTGMTGTCAIDGATLEEAIMRASLTFKRTPPRRGDHCQKGCPEYVDDCY